MLDRRGSLHELKYVPLRSSVRAEDFVEFEWYWPPSNMSREYHIMVDARRREVWTIKHGPYLRFAASFEVYDERGIVWSPKYAADPGYERSPRERHTRLEWWPVGVRDAFRYHIVDFYWTNFLQHGPDHVAMIGEHRFKRLIDQSFDGGLTWAASRLPPRTDLWQVTRSGLLVGSGRDVSVRSVDENWTRFEELHVPQGFLASVLVSGNLLYTVDRFELPRRVAVSGDLGDTWSVVDIVGAALGTAPASAEAPTAIPSH